MKFTLFRIVASLVLAITSLNAGVRSSLPTANMNQLMEESIATVAAVRASLRTEIYTDPDAGDDNINIRLQGKVSTQRIADLLAEQELVLGVVDVESPVYFRGALDDAKGKASWRAYTDLTVVPDNTGFVFNTNNLGFFFLNQPVLLQVSDDEKDRLRYIDIYRRDESGELEVVKQINFEYDSKETSFYFDPKWVGSIVAIAAGENYDEYFFGENGNRIGPIDIKLTPEVSFEGVVALTDANIHLGIESYNGFGQAPIVELTVTKAAQFDIRAETSEGRYPKQLIIKTYSLEHGGMVVVHDVPTQAGRAVVDLKPLDKGPEVYYVEWEFDPNDLRPYPSGGIGKGKVMNADPGIATQ